MDNDLITRSDLDNLSAHILISLGIINAAALAATFTNIEAFESQSAPFAIGLISAIVSQAYWYFISAVEYGCGDTKNVLNNWEASISFFILSLIIIILGFVSGGCLIYGGLIILGINYIYSILIAVLLCTLPLILFALNVFRNRNSQ